MWNSSLEPSARPPETMRLAAVSSGRSDLAISSETNADLNGPLGAAMVSTAALPPLARRLERGRLHRQHLLRLLVLHRDDRVAGIDRAHERVRALDADHARDLHHVELRRDARRGVLAGGRGRKQHRVVVRHQRRDQRFHRLGHLLGQGRAVGVQHLAHAVDLGGGLRGAAGIRARDQHVDIAAHRLGGGDDLVGGVLHGRVVVFGDNENGHQITPASLSLPTSSAAVFTLTPAWRLPGSAVFTTLRRGAISTPKSAGVFTSIGFFFAFMMFGSEA